MEIRDLQVEPPPAVAGNLVATSKHRLGSDQVLLEGETDGVHGDLHRVLFEEVEQAPDAYPGPVLE